MNGCRDDGNWVKAKRRVTNDNPVVEERWCENTGGGADHPAGLGT